MADALSTEIDLPQVGQTVRERRLAAKRGASEFAAEVGISRKHLNNIESGRMKASRPVYMLIASALSMELDQLLGVADEG